MWLHFHLHCWRSRVFLCPSVAGGGRLRVFRAATVVSSHGQTLLLFTEGEKLEDAGKETILHGDTAPIQASLLVSRRVNAGAELSFSNYCRPDGV